MVRLTQLRIFISAYLLLTLSACIAPTAPRQYSPDVAIPPNSAETSPTAPPVAIEEPQTKEVPVPSNNSRRTVKAAPPILPADPPAVLALLKEADASSATGRLDNAAATLERAIRIQPHNALLWHKLGEVRLQQHQPGLAEDLAKKSNLLAKDNKPLIRKNWAIIADARRQKGELQGASEADAKAKN